MPNQLQHKRLFQDPNADDKLKLFRTLLETRDELTVNLALALLKIIHSELSMDQSRDRLIYKRYAEGIASLRYYMPGVLQQVVNAWKSQTNNNTPLEWFAHGDLQ